MTLQTVGDLRTFLVDQGWSCEKLAEKVPVSNMTWRRLLKQPDPTQLPEKYRQMLEPLTGDATPTSIDEIRLVLTGMQKTQAEIVDTLSADGETIGDSKKVFRQAQNRARATLVPARLKGFVREVTEAFSTLGHTGKVLVLGGLVYFINPFDLIADPIVGLGFLDDVGIFAVIHQRLFGKKS